MVEYWKVDLETISYFVSVSNQLGVVPIKNIAAFSWKPFFQYSNIPIVSEANYVLCA
jgi:hypothetical protein